GHRKPLLMPCAAHAPHPDPCKDRAETAHRGKSLISRSRDEPAAGGGRLFVAQRGQSSCATPSDLHPATSCRNHARPCMILVLARSEERRVGKEWSGEG